MAGTNPPMAHGSPSMVHRSLSTPGSPGGKESSDWRRAYEAVLEEADFHALFKRVEVAQAAALTRRAALKEICSDSSERRQIEAALEIIRTLKRECLQFDDRSRSEISGATRKGIRTRNAALPD
jgi:hypothetical protein